MSTGTVSFTWSGLDFEADYQTLGYYSPGDRLNPSEYPAIDIPRIYFEGKDITVMAECIPDLEEAAYQAALGEVGDGQ